MIDVVTDEEGIAKIPHALNVPVKFSFTKDGFQYEEKDKAALSPNQAVIWALHPSSSTSGQVVSSKTGKPVPGAEILLLNHRGVYQASHIQKEYAPVLATTDPQGRFALSNLNNNGLHMLWVLASNEWAIVRDVRADPEKT